MVSHGIKEWSHNGDFIRSGLTTGGVQSGGLARCCPIRGVLAKGGLISSQCPKTQCFKLVQLQIHHEWYT